MVHADNGKASSDFKKNFQDSFWWAAPLSVTADLIAIFGLFSLKQQSLINQQSTPPGIPYAEPRIFGLITISDAVVLTGFVTLLIIVSTIYLSISLSQVRGDLWPYIFGSFLILVLGWFYFRLWLGEYGWIWILWALVLICGIATYLLSSAKLFAEIYRVGCTVATISLVILTVFLIVSTGAWSRLLNRINSPSTVSQDTHFPKPPGQRSESTPASTQTPGTENDPPFVPSSGENYIPYTLPRDTWFPLPLDIWDGLFAGSIEEVANEDVSGNDTGKLELFQSWGRITSYQRFYSHPDRCNSEDIQAVYIQIIFFQSSEGSKSFFNLGNEGATVKFVKSVGDNAYIYSWSDPDSGCQNDYVSTTFQRYNVIARARVGAIAEKMDYEFDRIAFIKNCRYD